MSIVSSIWDMERSQAFRFHTPSSMMIVGSSGCGKTVFTTKLLVDHPELFETPPPRIYYCYGSWQDGFKRIKKKRDSISRGYSRFGALTRVVSQEEKRVAGLGRSHERRRQRQARLRYLHQTFASPEHHRHLPLSRHVPARKIRQEHFAQRPLHREFKEPAQSIGYAQFTAASLSHPMARRTRHVSKSHGTPFRLSAIGSLSQEQRRPSHLESPAKRRGMHAMPSVEARCCAVKFVGFSDFYSSVTVT